MLGLPYRFENCEIVEIVRNVTKGVWMMEEMERAFHAGGARS